MNFQRHLKYISIALILVLSSCLDEIKLPQPDLIERIIVEGGITDNSSENFLRLSYSDAVGAPKRVLPTSGVYVEIRTAKGQKYTFRADPLGSGLFTAENGKLSGKAGEAYAIYLKLPDGREYQSEFQPMPVPVLIKNLNHTALEVPNVGYQVSLDLEDPRSEENYYRWKSEGFHIRQSSGVKIGYGDNYCCKTCWVKIKNEDINILSDQNFNGNAIKNRPVFFSPYFGIGMHKINVKQFNISRQAYHYYTKLKSQLNRSGSIFDPLPATVRGNIINIKDSDDTALGFFEVSSVSVKQTDILDEALKKYNDFYTNSNLYYLQGDCLLRFPYSIYFESNKQNLFE
jgi:Domain of unknown function (DUF4249)